VSCDSGCNGVSIGIVDINVFVPIVAFGPFSVGFEVGITVDTADGDVHVYGGPAAACCFSGTGVKGMSGSVNIAPDQEASVGPFWAAQYAPWFVSPAVTIGGSGPGVGAGEGGISVGQPTVVVAIGWVFDW
jgi:hypothetical protein